MQLAAIWLSSSETSTKQEFTSCLCLGTWSWVYRFVFPVRVYKRIRESMDVLSTCTMNYFFSIVVSLPWKELLVLLSSQLMCCKPRYTQNRKRKKKIYKVTAPGQQLKMFRNYNLCNDAVKAEDRKSVV